jgi:hypothetical protein
LRRIAGVLAAEASPRARRAPASPADGVPRSPAQVSPEWLTAALCRDAAGTRIVSVAQIAASSGTTDRAVLELACEGDPRAVGLPRRVFVKCTSSLAQRLLLGLGGLLEGEPGFYAHVRPHLAIEAPAGYFAALDRRSWRSIVVIEDVVFTRGASFPRAGESLTPVQVEELLAGAAAWHGALWQSPQLARWRWLKTPAEQMQVIDALIGLANRIPAGWRRAQDVIPAGVWSRRRDLLEAMRRSLQIVSREPRTYLHGDLHLANTYRTAAGRLGVCDWQVGLRGCWAHDVAYLLASALTVEDRRASERELLRSYLLRLEASGGGHVAFARAWDAYRQATLYPHFAWLYTLGRSRHQPGFQPPELALEVIRRIATAIDDLDSFAAVGL